MYRIISRKPVVAAGALALVVVLSVLLLLAPRGPASAQGPSTRFVSNDDFGFVEWVNGTTLGQLVVARSGNSQNPETLLFYLIFQTSPYLLIVEEGDGVIPNTDLIGSAAHRLTLSTDTSASANPGLNRIVGSGGVITIDWQRQRPSDFFRRDTGSVVQHFGDVFLSMHGTSEATLASAQGSVVGRTIGGTVIGTLGTNHGVTIEIQRGH